MGEAVQVVKGTVKTLNFGPKGEVDALMIEFDGLVVQANIAPEMADHALALVDQAIMIHVKPEPKVADHPRGEHPVFQLTAFTDADGKAMIFAVQPHEPSQPRPTEPSEVSGVVERFNYAKHGEANGVVLDSGDFVHLKPGGMKQFSLKRGEPITAKGRGREKASGGRALDPETINGVAVGPEKPH